MVLVDGELTLYMERGGKTLLAWPSDPEAPALRAAAEALPPRPAPEPWAR